MPLVLRGHLFFYKSDQAFAFAQNLTDSKEKSCPVGVAGSDNGGEIETWAHRAEIKRLDKKLLIRRTVRISKQLVCECVTTAFRPQRLC